MYTEKYRIFIESKEKALEMFNEISKQAQSKNVRIEKFILCKDSLRLLLSSGIIYEWYSHNTHNRGKKYNGAYIDLNLDENYIINNILPILIYTPKKEIFLFDTLSNMEYKISDLIKRLNIIRCLFGDLFVQYDYGTQEFIRNIKIGYDYNPINKNEDQEERVVILN